MKTSVRTTSLACTAAPGATALAARQDDDQLPPALESEYERSNLLAKRTLIRATCVFTTLLAGARMVEQALAGAGATRLAGLVLILAASALLVSLAWSGRFSSWYLPVARIVVPLRNALVCVLMTRAAVAGEMEQLMLLPLMVIGPFFFLGLDYRAALGTVLLTAVAFVASAPLFGMPPELMLRATAFLAFATVVSAIAARHLDKAARRSFLDSRVVAELARRDHLTGLNNRAVFDQRLQELWSHAAEQSRTLAVLVIDVDDFKAYNDAYGHQAGDETLRRVAQILRRLVSSPRDVLARYGGEEFAVVLYDVDGDEARATAERLRAAVANAAISHRASRVCPLVTISIGAAVVEPALERQAGGALQLADQALYEAKIRGRNRVELMDQAAHQLLVTGVFKRSGN